MKLFLLVLCLCVLFAQATKVLPAVKRLDDRLAGGKCAVVTLVYEGDTSFVLGAATLGYSLRESKTRMSMVALVTEQVDEKSRYMLGQAGWQIHDAKAVANPNPEYFPRLEYIFTKLQIYTLTNYDRVVYLDADTLVNENVDELCSCNAYHCSVLRNTFFNSGVIVAIPSTTIYADMMSKYTTMHSYTGGDQGFLNNYFWNGEECPFFDPKQKLESALATDVSHLRCHRLPGYYNGDVGVYVSRGDKWQFDPEEERQQPKITHFTLSIFKPWSWMSYIVIKYNWTWFEVFSRHVQPSPAFFFMQIITLGILAFTASYTIHRIRLDRLQTIFGILMMNRIGRAFFGHLQHLCVFLFALYYSNLTFINPTFSLALFFVTYCILFEIFCVNMWQRYWETAAGTRLVFDYVSETVHKVSTCVSLAISLIALWSDFFSIYGRAAIMIIWLFCIPGVAHTIFYQIPPTQQLPK